MPILSSVALVAPPIPFSLLFQPYELHEECVDNIAIYCGSNYDYSEHKYTFDRCRDDQICGTYSSAITSGDEREAACMNKCDKVGESRDFVCIEDNVTFEETFPVRSYRYTCKAFEAGNGWHYESERCYHGCEAGKCNYIHAQEGKECTEEDKNVCDGNVLLSCISHFWVAEDCAKSESVCSDKETVAKCVKE